MRVSIVIPCYNVEDYIDDALASALSQSHDDIEIICVDNESTDKTLEYLKNYVERGEVKLLHQSKKGAPAARNMGWRAASGKWIQFLDADDMLLPEKISHQVKLIANNPKAVLVASQTRKSDIDTGDSFIWPVHENKWHGLIQNQLGITSANLFSVQALENVEGWDEEMRSSQEYDLMFRIMQSGGEVLLDNDDVLSVIRSRSSGSISTEDVLGNKHRFLHLVSRIATHLKKELPKVYIELGADYFTQAYRRIVLNALEGKKDSSYFHRSILPDGFIPPQDDLRPPWFLFFEKHFGFGLAVKVAVMKQVFGF